MKLELLLEKTINQMLQYAQEENFQAKVSGAFMRLNGQLDVIQTLSLLPASEIEKYETTIQDTYVSLMHGGK